MTITPTLKKVFVTGGSRLPSAYQEVEYLQVGTTNECYFNLGGIQANASISLKLQMPSGRSYIDSYFGNGTASNLLTIHIDNSQYGGAPYYFGARASSKFPIEITSPHIYKIAPDGIYYDGNYLSGYTSTPSTTGISSNVWLLGAYGFYWGTKVGTRLYYCAIDYGTTTAKNFIPCYRKSDSVAGMYDLVNGVFYTNAGTGTFIVGPDVSSLVITPCYKTVYVYRCARLPSAYQEVEYLQSDRQSWIDTGVLYKQGITSIIDIIPPSAQYTSIFGNGFIGSGSPYSLWRYPDHIQFAHNAGVTVLSNDILSRQTFTIVGDDTRTTDDAYIWMFRTKASNISDATFFSCKIYDDSTLIRDFIPCYRKSDSVAGMYDLVNNTFYTNAGTGSFIVGPDANPLTTVTTRQTNFVN